MGKEKNIKYKMKHNTVQFYSLAENRIPQYYYTFKNV